MRHPRPRHDGVQGRDGEFNVPYGSDGKYLLAALTAKKAVGE